MQEKARKEIMSTFGDEIDDDLSNELIENLHYTNAFIKETMRYFSPVPLNGRQAKVDCRFGA